MIFIWWHLISQLTSKYMLNFFDKKNHDHITRVIALLFQRRRVRHLSNETFGKVHLWPNLSTGKICHAVQKKVSFRPIMCPEKSILPFSEKYFHRCWTSTQRSESWNLANGSGLEGTVREATRMRNDDGVEDDSWDYKQLFFLENDTNL